MNLARSAKQFVAESKHSCKIQYIVKLQGRLMFAVEYYIYDRSGGCAQTYKIVLVRV